MSSATRRVICLLTLITLFAGPSVARELWLDVPFVQQSREGCGSACIVMVMKYWDRRTRGKAVIRDDEQMIYRKLHTSKARGIRADAMEEYLIQQGYRVFAFSGSWQDLREHISKGRPVIVCLKARSAHYTVVSGIDPDLGIVLLNDPARRKLLKMRRSEFEKDWHGSGNWTLLALPQE